MIVKLFLFYIALLIFEIFYFINGGSVHYYEDLKHTKRALQVMSDMSRRMRRQSVRMGMLKQKKNFNAVDAWKRGYRKIRILNIMKNPYLYQGDVLFTKIQASYMVNQIRVHLKRKGIRYPQFFFLNSTRIKRKVKSDVFYKWDMPVAYFVKQGVNPQTVDSALLHLQQRTCLRFQRSAQPLPVGMVGIHYIYGDGCQSYIGKVYTDRAQEVSLGNNCDHPSLVQHETLHAMGLFHEQSRYDRDKYINVIQQNVIPNQLHNFDIVDREDSENYGLPYDYTSVMHYPISLFSVNDQPTTFPKDKTYAQSVGTQDALTFIDVKFINIHYCSHICPRGIQCVNWGYQDPNNCNQCKCPPGFHGRDCGNIGWPSNECGQTVYKITDQVQAISVQGSKICIFMIEGQPGTKIAYKIVESRVSPGFTDHCSYENTVEVKYWKDKSVSGARYCLRPMEIPRFSNDDLLEVVYRSNQTNNFAFIVFKAVTNF
uniref:Zinc metalloproteinase n=1 Tax=Strongyloides stercoralis TaxID=6248 RepID=A0A0K0EJM4_STRER